MDFTFAKRIGIDDFFKSMVLRRLNIHDCRYCVTFIHDLRPL